MSSALWDFFINGTDRTQEKRELDRLKDKENKTKTDKENIERLKDRINDTFKGRYI